MAVSIMNWHQPVALTTIHRLPMGVCLQLAGGELEGGAVLKDNITASPFWLRLSGACNPLRHLLGSNMSHACYSLQEMAY